VDNAKLEKQAKNIGYDAEKAIVVGLIPTLGLVFILRLVQSYRLRSLIEGNQAIDRRVRRKFLIMHPRHVADSIRFGIQNGWKPGEAGNDFWLAFDCGSDNESLLEYVPNNDFRVVTYHTHGELPKNADATQFADTRKWYDRKIVPDNVN
jgi:hypothetical protein